MGSVIGSGFCKGVSFSYEAKGEGNMSMQQLTGSSVIRVKVWRDRNKKSYTYGQVIGSSDGMYGVLLNTGEYVDVPEHQLNFV